MEPYQSKQKIKFRLIKSLFIGLIAIVAAVYFVYSAGGIPYHEYLLITKGITTRGFVIAADENAEDGDDGRAHFSYYYSYTFRLPDGREITSHGESQGRLPNELTDLSEPYPVNVVYIKTNPEINKIKNTISKNIGELLWRKIGLGLILLLAFLSIGFVLIKNAIKEYSLAMNKHKEYVKQ